MATKEYFIREELNGKGKGVTRVTALVVEGERGVTIRQTRLTADGEAKSESTEQYLPGAVVCARHLDSGDVYFIAGGK